MTGFEILPIFVYGTLQRGEQRERCWPRPPRSVEPAWTLGRLHDLGPYPALGPPLGPARDYDDRVLGELWHVASEDMAETLRVLDDVEGYAGRSDDLYLRRVIACQPLADSPHDAAPRQAYAYIYADLGALAASPRVVRGADGFCRWSGGRRRHS